MKCKKCGEELPEKARFCPGCGAPVEEVPAPKKLEEPLDPMAAGAVPLVPVAPPPRAVRVTPRIPRPYVPHSSQSASRRSPYTHYNASYDALRPEESAAARRALRERAAASAPVPQEPPAQEQEVADAPKTMGAPEAAPAAANDVPDAEKTVDFAMPSSEGPAASELEPELQQELRDLPDLDGVSSTEADDTSSIQFRPAVDSVPDFEPAPAGDGDAHASSFPTEAFDRVRGGAARVGDRMRSFQPDRRVVLGVCAAIAALLVGGVCYAVATSWLGPFAPEDEPAPPVEQPSTEPVETLESQEEQDEEPVSEGAPEVRSALADYSWEELSQISALIAAAESDEAGIEIAAQYNLCDASGRLNLENTKTLELSSGTSVPVTIAGFRQDAKSDGSGLAGISFVARGSVGTQPLNASGESVPWEETTLRSWLNQTLMGELPEELASAIVPVDKVTNNPAGSGGGQSTTSESVWIPSCAELSGDVAAQTTNSDYTGYLMEGGQYDVFADAGVTWNDGFDYLRLESGEDWWLRTPEPSSGEYYMTVTPEGSPHYYRNPARELAIVVGFCL